MSARRIAGLLVAGALAAGALAAPAEAVEPPKFERVSRAAGGGQTNGAPGAPDISADGRWVVFASGADNITPPDANNEYDVFLVDRRTGQVRNLTAGANGASDAPRISADGRRVVFVSLADNLVPGSADPAVATHTFVWTRGSGAIRQVDVDVAGAAPDAGSSSPDLSADGKVVVFTSRATDLVPGTVTAYQHVYRRDLAAGTTAALEPGSSADASYPSVDADGNRVAYSSLEDVLLWRPGAQPRILTPALAAAAEQPSISAAGDRVALRATDGIHLVDVRTGRTRLLARGPATAPAISDDGKHVTFNADRDLLPGDTNQQTDVYRWSVAKNRVVRISGGARPGSGFARPTRDGALVVFVSDDRLLPGDTNQFRDVFVRRLG